MITEQGRRSGTAYYWVGEFCIMFGWLGYLLGPCLLFIVYKALISAAARLTRTPAEYAMAAFLLAAIIGYYQFGRGYFPQIFKSYLFVFIPYLLLCYSNHVVFVWNNNRSMPGNLAR